MPLLVLMSYSILKQAVQVVSRLGVILNHGLESAELERDRPEASQFLPDFLDWKIFG